MTIINATPHTITILNKEAGITQDAKKTVSGKQRSDCGFQGNPSIQDSPAGQNVQRTRGTH